MIYVKKGEPIDKERDSIIVSDIFYDERQSTFVCWRGSNDIWESDTPITQDTILNALYKHYFPAGLGGMITILNGDQLIVMNGIIKLNVGDKLPLRIHTLFPM